MLVWIPSPILELPVDFPFSFGDFLDGEISNSSKIWERYDIGTLTVRKADGIIKLQVYRKPTHTDQCLNYQSHHPVHQKLGVVRTLMDRKDHIVTKEEDKINEEKKVVEALKIYMGFCKSETADGKWKTEECY